MTKRKFELRTANNETQTVDYYPLIHVRGTDAWRLALHREPVLAGKGEWILSDPVSGYRICRVTAYHNGVPVTSRHLTVKQAREMAMVDFDALIDRLGAARINKAMSEAQARVKAQA